jgi:hypothetical protein
MLKELQSQAWVTLTDQNFQELWAEIVGFLKNQRFSYTGISSIDSLEETIDLERGVYTLSRAGVRRVTLVSGQFPFKRIAIGVQPTRGRSGAITLCANGLSSVAFDKQQSKLYFWWRKEKPNGYDQYTILTLVH